MRPIDRLLPAGAKRVAALGRDDGGELASEDPVAGEVAGELPIADGEAGRFKGNAAADVRPIAGPLPGARPFALAAGAFVVPDDFDAPLPEDVLREFEGQ